MSGFAPSRLPVFCLMGPTATGKTALAIQLVYHFPCEIISVDSAMVYRGMDIGTAKPDAITLQQTPHHLIDCVDPKESYSAGRFYREALSEIKAIHAKRKIPLLVGGTMLYFRVLQQGLAPLPSADKKLREQFSQQAASEGWGALHAELQRVDPQAAVRIHHADSQRIQRALEVFYLTGKPLSIWQREATTLSSIYDFHSLALIPAERSILHERIAERFDDMLAKGWIAEVEQLYARGDLHADLPALRTVGYKQIWSYLAGQLSYEQMCDQAIAATRQLAKRQLTWLRSWPALQCVTAEASNVQDNAMHFIQSHLS